MQEIEAEIVKGDKGDEDFLSSRLRKLKRIAPDILEVVLATITNPAAGLDMVAMKVAEKAKAEAG